MTVGERIKQMRIEIGLTQEELAKLVGYKSRSSINKIEIGERDITQSTIVAFAKALNTSPSVLMGWEEDENQTNKKIESNCEFLPEGNIYMIPVYDSVSAGFGTYADSAIVGYEPTYIKNAYEKDNYLRINVKGDSMSPLIDDGSQIVVCKKSSVDSGDIAVILIDGDEGVVKKVEYKPNCGWVNLISINPYYPVRRFKGDEELSRLKVVGKVVQVIKLL